MQMVLAQVRPWGVGVRNGSWGFDEPYKRYSEQYTKWSRKKQDERKDNLLAKSEEATVVEWPDVVQEYEEAVENGDIERKWRSPRFTLRLRRGGSRNTR